MENSNFAGCSDSEVLLWVDTIIAKSKELANACKLNGAIIAYDREFREEILVYSLADLLRIAKVTGWEYKYTINSGTAFDTKVSVQVGEITFYTFVNKGEVDEIISD